ncbi:hypothetical protein [Aquicoccus porphyridii]|uniref:hypothetical protein n=1 Tax=Aquicoccus porphyridii TaxID=1852029 RepID=UPI00273F7288|nr:hypothetical protein [Aquicoccus porphyridii]
MDISLAYPGPPCEVPGFDPDEDVLVIALPDALLATSAPWLSLHHDHAANRLDLTVSLAADAPPLVIHLPGLVTLPSDAVVLLSLSDSRTLGPEPAPAAHPAPANTTAAVLTGEGLYPPEEAPGSARPSSPPTRHRFAPRHDWRRDGPPPECFFDLSHPDSELLITLPPATQGPVHAIRFNETTASAGSSDTHGSIVLIQSPPGSPPLSPAALTARFATSLGAPDFRAIAWIWLGNEGHFTDPASGERRAFGRINHNPTLAITGPIAGSVEIRR